MSMICLRYQSYWCMGVEWFPSGGGSTCHPCLRINRIRIDCKGQELALRRPTGTLDEGEWKEKTDRAVDAVGEWLPCSMLQRGE